MGIDIKKNGEIDFSQYFNQKNKFPREESFSDKTIGAKNNKNKYFIALIAGNFILGVVFFSYLISKSNESNSTAPVALETMAAPINYQVKSGETYRLPLP
ncbi:MAG: hypothetical protein WCX69_01300 [Candidatus Paceibacterota bacterium]